MNSRTITSAHLRKAQAQIAPSTSNYQMICSVPSSGTVEPNKTFYVIMLGHAEKVTISFRGEAEKVMTGTLEMKGLNRPKVLDMILTNEHFEWARFADMEQVIAELIYRAAFSLKKTYKESEISASIIYGREAVAMPAAPEPEYIDIEDESAEEEEEGWPEEEEEEA